MSTLKRKAGLGSLVPDAKKSKSTTTTASSNASITSFFGLPKSADAPNTAIAKFDKVKWVNGLTAEQRRLLELEINTLHPTWLAQLKDDIVKLEFLELKRFLDREANVGRKVFPPREDVYSWSRHTPFPSVKVVILGQDPYHNINQAHGLAFSVRPPTPAPPSLRNMYTCLKNDYPSFTPPPRNAGLLTLWADRGVLLLNTCLTVRAHEANSHANRGWERFTQRIIDLVAARRTSGVVFLAWGTPAGKRVQCIDRTRHLVLTSVHPSPLSAARGFFDCGHFRKANEWLVKRYGPDGDIDWALIEGNSTKSSATKTKSEGHSADDVASKEQTKVAADKEEKEATKSEGKGKQEGKIAQLEGGKTEQEDKNCESGEAMTTNAGMREVLNPETNEAKPGGTSDKISVETKPVAGEDDGENVKPVVAA